MIGFALDYRRSDEAFIITRWAKWLESRGLDVSFFPYSIDLPVCPHLDSRVKRNKNKNYDEWVVTCSHIVFSFPPQPELVARAKHFKKTTVLLLLWEDINQDDCDSIELMDSIVCPAKTIYKHLASIDIHQNNRRRIFSMPWDLMLPAVRNDQEVDGNRVGVVWNLDGSQAEAQDFSFFDMFENIVDIEFLYFTIFYNDKLSAMSLNKLDELKYRADGRIELIKNPSMEMQVSITAIHDLTMWPSTIESAGVPGLVSILAGTPCIAYDYPVVSEIIKDHRSGILVPCDLETNDVGVPKVVADNESFGEALTSLANDVELLQHLRSTTQSGFRVQTGDFRIVVYGSVQDLINPYTNLAPLTEGDRTYVCD